MKPQLNKIYKSEEEHLSEVKRKTIPFDESIYGRSPLFHQPPPDTKHYTELEIFEQQQKYKANYHNPKLKDIMGDATKVLLAIMEQEKK